MKIALFTRYDRLGASSRYRSYQYLPALEQRGFEVVPLPLLPSDYLRGRYARGATASPARLARIVGRYARRASQLLRARRFDLIWVEKELFPWLPYGLERLLRPGSVPYVVDYDDATFHRYDQHASGAVQKLLGTKIDGVMRDAAAVLAGNRYLAGHARQAGARRVEIFPTVVDLERYQLAPRGDANLFTVGWIGTPLTARYLQTVAPALRQLAARGPVRLLAIGSGPLELPGVPLEVRDWSEATEVRDLAEIDVGIMPLPDSPWERGKCGLKLIQYQAAGRAVVASPVGVNREIVEPGLNGFLAETEREWVAALTTLRESAQLRGQLGEAGRRRVEERYSLQASAPRLAQLLHTLAGAHARALAMAAPGETGP